MSRLTEKVKTTDDYIKLATKDKQEFINKLGRLEDLEEQLGCPLEVFVKAFKKYVGWTTDCNFGYDNIPNEYRTYKNDERFKTLSYNSGLIYIAIQEALKEAKVKAIEAWNNRSE